MIERPPRPGFPLKVPPLKVRELKVLEPLKIMESCTVADGRPAGVQLVPRAMSAVVPVQVLAVWE